MKNIVSKFFLVLIIIVFSSCDTRYNIIDTGTANGKHDKTMWEYLLTDKYNWELTVEMIQKSGLESLFRGKQQGYEKITFFGPTSHSIRRYLYQNGMESVSELDNDFCKKIILNSVIKGVYRREDIPFGKPSTNTQVSQGTGGKVFTGANNNQFWIYSFREPYNGVPETGPVVLNIVSLKTNKSIDVASTNIETNTGVVHSLHYNFTISEL
ncbi:MAG: fasciclin domain-containing protein [Bacteroidia bacterium]|nr:fasciclin domain-containing protein [Bacteroidia bacterium]